MDFTFRKGFTFAAGILTAYGIYELVHLAVQLYIVKLGVQAFLG